MAEQILNWMMTDKSAGEDSLFSFSDVFYAGKVMSITVEKLCHYHPMGTYYYVALGRGGDL